MIAMPRSPLAVAALLLAACAPESPPAEESMAEETEAVPAADGRIVSLLAEGQPVFGIFSGDHTPEQGAAMGANTETDFVFYSLESGPFDLPGMQSYVRAMQGVAGEDSRPMALRIPPIKDGPAEAEQRIVQALETGVEAIVYPHTWSSEDVALAAAAMGDELWPGKPGGRLVGMFIVEDRTGIEHVDEIVSTPGASVVFAGPGDLRRAYEGDMEAVEAAIQTVLAACLEHGVPCGITAGVDDIAGRLEQGFRVIIVTEPEALAVGLRASGRTQGS
ncbi:MAG TPA: aldolase/citrate lyase family protein [Longimicrobiales bacterium]|nr:aldolase/citrate lyase family protein [Longimicrobiales bacterium]